MVLDFLLPKNFSLRDDEAYAFEQFVANGGGALLLHNGISIQSQDRILTLAGAKFLGHPHHEVIRFEPSAHPVIEGCKSFSLDEEPYQFELVPADLTQRQATGVPLTEF